MGEKPKKSNEYPVTRGITVRESDAIPDKIQITGFRV